MYDILPNEIINIIYEFDNTYHVEYNLVIKTIENLPTFVKVNNKIDNIIEYQFKKDWKIIKITEYFVTKNINYKKAFLCIINAFSKAGTLIKY